MNRFFVFIVFAFSIAQSVCCQHYTISGKVISQKDKSPIDFATITLLGNELWAVTNGKGEFTLKNVPRGKTYLTAYCLGYARRTIEVNLSADVSNLTLALPEDNLALDEVVVTAQRKTNSQTTSYTLDRAALEHAQILNVSDVSGLLPGGKSKGDLNLAKDDDRFLLRSATAEKGNPSFGTAVEVDGVRMQNNASFGETNGVSTRNISTANIESVEVVTGIPSVEYGDLSNGMVKINTRKGKAPLTVDFSTKPNTKQVALGKGFLLGSRAGVVNLGVEHTKSNSDLASPYTTYTRNGLSLSYSNTFRQANQSPVKLELGVNGNLGGYDTKADPDAFQETRTEKRDNTFNGYLKLHWLLNKPWMTNLELSGAVSYSDRLSRVNVNKNSASSQPAIHSMEEGYFIATRYDEDPGANIILTPPGYWYQLSHDDSKPVSYSAKLKADWVHTVGRTTNKILLGAEFTSTGNKGRGLHYDDMRYAPTWREYRYDALPFVNNVALYAEDKLSMPVNDLSTLSLTAGLRSDITYIKGSEYGTVNSFSPRFNAKYTFWEKSSKAVRDLSVYAGWGKAVKLPSFEVLYPSPTYSDKLAFAPGTLNDGTTFYAYYTIPGKAMYNPDLKWQYNQQTEIGLEANIKGTRVSVSMFRNKTFHPYVRTNVYTPYSYNLTDQKSLDGVDIPWENRAYTIDRATGVVTVSDKTGVYGSRQLPYQTRNTFKSNARYTNGSPVERRGMEWSISFAQIRALRTSIRLDGNYYYYKGIDETMIEWMPNSTQMMADGNPYKYVGYYAGSSSTSTSTSASASAANGTLSKQLNTNLTVTTHIPKIRLILSLKIESTLYDYKRNLSEYSDGTPRGFVLNDGEGYFGTDTHIYGGDRFVAVYPLYYSTWEDPGTKYPFAEKFKWAKENDTALYNELAKLVVKSNSNYYFNANRISSYFSTDISVTKEIGNFASVSFFATNFLNNMSLVKSSQTDTESSLYNSSYIPRFYYGLSVRFKL